MKKSIIAMAVAGALAVPAIASADATLYGHIMMAVDKEKNEKLTVGTVGNSESRIGLRGTADTGVDGLTGIYNVEFGVTTTQTSYEPLVREMGAYTGAQNRNTLRTRLANVGLTGDWGTALVGTQWAPHYSWVTGTTDVMLSSAANVLRATDVVYRVDNTLAYVSPDFNGLQLAAAVSGNKANSDKNADFVHVAAKYGIAGFGAGLSYIDFNSEDAFEPLKDVTAVALSYETGPFFIGATYSHLRIDGADNYKPWDIAATYAVSDATKLKLAYADFREGAKGYGVEVQHDLSNSVNMFVGYGNANSDLRDTVSSTVSGATYNSVFSTGMRVRF
ncbi:porin [Nitrincola schmidtii]|uniref:porin n=1 Tax=Nitrincola schmidtii TaxID=1730894 RepID=UPI00124E6748|nr:porin [Nitrincola schmidtii]